MNAVICRVAGDDQPYVRYVQHGGGVGVSVPDVDRDHLMAFNLEGWSV